jgi:hypothetical protein
MNQAEILDSDIRALQQWLRAAWQQLGDPSLTTYSRRELRNQMKQCGADLRERLQMLAEQQSEPVPATAPRLLPARAAHPVMVTEQGQAPAAAALWRQR